MSVVRTRRGARFSSRALALACCALGSVGTGLASAHAGHSHVGQRAAVEGKLAGKPDYERVGNEIRRFDEKRGVYTVDRPGLPTLSYHVDPGTGPDAAAGGAEHALPTQELAPVCASRGHRIVPVLHRQGYPADPAKLELIRSIVRRMNWKINHESAKSSGGGRALLMRVECDASQQIIVREKISGTNDDTDAIRVEVEGGQPPYGADSVKYLVFRDGPDPIFEDGTSAAGVGYGYHSGSQYSALKSASDSPFDANNNRFYTTTAITWRNYWETQTPIHELVHVMGGAQNGAPSASARAHCVDGLDILCYDDAGRGRTNGYVTTACPANGIFNTPAGVPLDCNFDTYFDALPETGEWLNANWNVGGHENPFLVEDQASPSSLIETLYDQEGPGGWGWSAYDLAAAAPQQQPIAGNPSAIELDGKARLYSRSPSGHLLETLTDWLGGRVWNAYDLTADVGAWATIAGDPAPLVVGGLPRVYAVNAAGALLEFIPGPARWEAYNMTSAAGAPPIVGRPAVTMLNGYPRAYARTTAGALIEFVWSGQNGRSWEWYDLSSATSGPQLAGDPSVLVIDGNPHVYYRTTTGQLFRTSYGNGSGSWRWSSSNLTAATGGPTIASDPAPILADGNPRIYAVSGAGALTETLYGNGPSGWAWSWYGLSALTGAPPLVDARPAVLRDGGGLRIYTRSTSNRLIETLYGTDGRTWGWSSYDLTFHTGAQIASAPSAIVFGGGPRIYSRGRFP